MRACILALAWFVAFGSAGSVHAQGTDDGAALLRANLRAGDQVTLSLSDSVVRGKLLAITPDALLVQTQSGETRVPFAAVNEARRKRMGIFLGPIIGAVAGVGPGVVGALLSGTATEGTVVLLGNIGLGAAIGAGIDAMVNRNRTVYRRGAGSQVVLSPAVAPDVAGVRITVTW